MTDLKGLRGRKQDEKTFSFSGEGLLPATSHDPTALCPAVNPAADRWTNGQNLWKSSLHSSPETGSRRLAEGHTSLEGIRFVKVFLTSRPSLLQVFHKLLMDLPLAGCRRQIGRYLNDASGARPFLQGRRPREGGISTKRGADKDANTNTL